MQISLPSSSVSVPGFCPGFWYLLPLPATFSCSRVSKQLPPEPPQASLWTAAEGGWSFSGCACKGCGCTLHLLTAPNDISAKHIPGPASLGIAACNILFTAKPCWWWYTLIYNFISFRDFPGVLVFCQINFNVDKMDFWRKDRRVTHSAWFKF